MRAKVREKACCVFIVLALPALALGPGAGCRRASGPQPPDLSACTRLEVHDSGGAVNYARSESAIHAGIFDREEQELLRSFEVYTITRRQVIQAFARAVAQGVYVRRSTAHANPAGLSIVCYRGDEQVTSLRVYAADYIKTADGSVFQYAAGVLALSGLRPPEIEPLRLRSDCAFHESRLTADSLLFRRGLISYPDPNRWCEVTANALWRLHGGRGAREEDATTVALFRCPAAQGSTGARAGSPWVSHYALNPNCRPAAPGDVVLLFETTSGWNQRGGPELFTFDNHNPRGGCVLFNDGAVRFIRTAEELAQLRWKP